tara:strand:- start:2552 stop:2740 length:189 start_codon:yes stop_codon:yes gene_type:complete
MGIINNMSKIDFTSNIDNKDEFINSIKNEMDVTAFNALNAIKKEMASDFIKGDTDDDTKSEK